MKIKMLNMSDCKDIVKSKFFCEHVNENDFYGRICILKFESVSKIWKTSDSNIILDNGYIWLEFYPYNCNYCYTAMFDEKNNIIEWYIDITKTIEEKNDKYVEDLFIDFVLFPNGKFFILDEEELEEAYANDMVDKMEYSIIMNVKESIIKNLKDINITEILNFTNKYKNKLIKKYNL